MKTPPINYPPRPPADTASNRVELYPPRPHDGRSRPSREHRRLVTPIEARAQARAELERRRRRVRRTEAVAPGTSLTLREYIGEVAPHFVWYRHLEADAENLQAVADGQLLRYMRFMPPRHGKSELGSRLFSSYYVARHPDRWMLLVGHTSDLAEGMSDNARDYYEYSGRRLRSRKAKEWRTYRGGGMRAAGIRAKRLTGKGFHCGHIDDPIADAMEAASDLILQRHREWFDSTFLTRAEPGASILLTMTRWRYNDLAGYILKQERAEPENWHILRYEAIRTTIPVEKDLPKTCTVEPDPREPGEELCKERYPAKVLGKIQRRLKATGMARYWTALFQQRPGAEEGNIWKRAWFPTWQTFSGELPAGVFSVGKDWDLAYTKHDENAASAYVEAGRDAAGNVYILDVGWRWLEFPELIHWMKQLGGPHYIEAKGPGKSAKQTLARQGVLAIEVPVKGGLDKQARTRLVTPIGEAGRIFVHERVLGKLLDDEEQGILKFPTGPHSDLNDAFVQMLNRLAGWALPRYRSLSSKEDDDDETD